MKNTVQIVAQAQALEAQGNLAEAKKLYAKVLRQEKNNIAALFHLALLEAQAGDYETALGLANRAHKTAPSSADILALKGRILNALARNGEAADCYEAALKLNDTHPGALLNLGCTLLLLNRSGEALGFFDRLVALMPNEPIVHHNRAIALTDIGHYDQAIASADAAIKLRPHYAEALQARGIAYGYTQRHDLALKDFRAAITLNPQLDYLIGNLINAQLWSSDWDGLAERQRTLLAAVKAGRRAVTPFSFVSMSTTAAEQLLCAQTYAATIPVSPTNVARYQHEKIRIAYLSADFREHPTSYLLAGVFEQHDRSRFETTAISFGAEAPSEMLTRLKGAFDRFINVNDRTDAEIGHLLKSLEIDIALDLMGYTGGARVSVMAQRAAPIQVNYLAYPGTMAASYIDYIIADHMLIPDDHRSNYTEKIVYLPHSYAPTDSARAISERAITRAEMGLPDDGFVFCCFNNSYKLNPDMLDRVSGILKAVPGGVLWLPEHNDIVTANLKKEAAARGLDPAKLIFAKRMPSVADHLARLQLADLFLDTLPNNAHTTASDSLWAGVPILTQIGATFAGRVAASLLNAVGLPELITETNEAYETMAIELAVDRAKLATIRQKLARNRTAMPLFNTANYTRYLETALQTMSEHHQEGLPPDHIEISD
ncbi:MAG: tetratricopeptide repeat protein [Pseudolabrys sp.]|nr:tetratricopeptide repeat protein [Pseudolabrys sp.]